MLGKGGFGDVYKAMLRGKVSNWGVVGGGQVEGLRKYIS